MKSIWEIVEGPTVKAIELHFMNRLFHVPAYFDADQNDEDFLVILLGGNGADQWDLESLHAVKFGPELVIGESIE